jgi:hypothetical protein
MPNQHWLRLSLHNPSRYVFVATEGPVILFDFKAFQELSRDQRGSRRGVMVSFRDGRPGRGKSSALAKRNREACAAIATLRPTASTRQAGETGYRREM